MEKKLQIPAFLHRNKEGQLLFSLSKHLPSIVVPSKYDGFDEIKKGEGKEISIDFNITVINMQPLDTDKGKWFICEYDDETEEDRSAQDYIPSMFKCLYDNVEEFVFYEMDGWDVGNYRRMTKEELIKYHKKND